MPNNQLFTKDDQQNWDAYDGLMVSIQAKEDKLSLLICVLDDWHLRTQIISEYEQELDGDFQPYRVTLGKGEPSITAAISELIENEEYLRQGGKAVITVIGAEQLYFLKTKEEKKSELEIFFGYLQWTREALRQFPYPIIIWVTNKIVAKLIKNSPDFWSWRNGVFHFVSRKRITVSEQDIKPIRSLLSESLLLSDDDNSSSLPIADLQQFIKQKEAEGVRDSSLATLYFSLAKIYDRRLDEDEFQDYQNEQNLAIEYFNKAIELQKELGLETELATSWNNLALLYNSQGRYTEAEPLYIQALEMRKRLFKEDHTDVAQSLNNLALLYKIQGRYTEAESLDIQSLEMRKRLFTGDHPYIATSLNNLATLYDSQGKYTEAEPLYIQALEMTQRLFTGDHTNVAISLNNLATLYDSQGRYIEAEPLYIQALEMRQRLFTGEHPDVATSLNNLATLYKSQGKYTEAEPLYIQALEMTQQVFTGEHPDVAQSLNNLAALYKSQGRYTEAEPLYLQALEMCERVLGVNHPNTVFVRKNLEILQAKMEAQ